MNLPPLRGRFLAKYSAISVEGVIGYPAKKLAPATKAPSAQASFPWRILAFLFCSILNPQDFQDFSSLASFGLTVMAKSGHLNSHRRHWVHLSGIKTGSPSLSATKAPVGQKAIQILHLLHQASKIWTFSKSSFGSFLASFTASVFFISSAKFLISSLLEYAKPKKILTFSGIYDKL